MRFKILAAGAALALFTTVVLSQAGAQTAGTIDVQQTATNVTIVASGCDTGTVSLAMVLPDGSIESVNATSIGSGRFSHLIEVGATTQTGNYSVTGQCKTETETLITYEQKAFTVGAAAATPTPVVDPTAVATETATAVPTATTTATATGTQTATGTMNLTASSQSLEIGKNAVLTMTGCPGTQPVAGESYRASLETTDPLGTVANMTHDFTDNTTHEMVFTTTGATQPGNHTIVGRCEKKAGETWAEVYRYQAVTIAVGGVAAGGTATPQATATTPTTTTTPAPTAIPTTSTPARIGFTG